jgi:hypothetical protein
MTIVEALIRFETVCFEQRGADVKPTVNFGFERLGTSKQLKILGGMQNFFAKGQDFQGALRSLSRMSRAIMVLARRSALDVP